MALVSLRGVSLTYGGPPLFDGVDFQVGRGERVCLVGRNGTGKSTLMKLLSREVQPDAGEVWHGQGVKVAYLEQEVPEATSGRVFDVVAQGLGEIEPLLRDYHRILEELESGGSEAQLAALERAQHRLEAADGWSVEQRIEMVLTRLSLDATLEFSTLSGGMKRRVLLARALVSEPDVLLLDEPTNHLDLRSILWLEGFLRSYPGTVLFVTHDRRFLQALATRIDELDRGRLLSYPGNYATYLGRREAALVVEAEVNAEFDKKLVREEAWLRKGMKARRARNEGRVRALEQLRSERQRRRERIGSASIQIQEARKSGKIVAEAEDISKAYDGVTLFRNLTTTIRRGDRIGVIGPNGCGKTTLLSVLLGEVEPDSGEVRLGTQLEIAYFDQMRGQLDEEKSVAENVVPVGDTVEINGRRKHVVGYLQEFLFSPERARVPVKALSGGERNRLLLARLLAKPANLLVMDEPTNDLDCETLELLEERLLGYQGTLLLVSHDREFLDNVVTSSIVFDDGQVKEYVGGYDDWQRQRAVEQAAARSSASAPVKKAGGKPRSKTKPSTKLSYKETQLLEILPAKIEALEEEQQGLQAEMLKPGYYQRPAEDVAAAQRRLKAVVAETEEAYRLWEELDARS